MPQGELAKSLCSNTALGSVTTSSWSWGVIGSWGRCLVGDGEELWWQSWVLRCTAYQGLDPLWWGTLWPWRGTQPSSLGVSMLVCCTPCFEKLCVSLVIGMWQGEEILHKL